MNVFVRILGLGWVGAVLGIVGIVVSVLIHKASRVGGRPVYQTSSLRLIGKEEQALPTEVEITYMNQIVPRLTRTNMVFWNSGNATIHGEHIVEADPIAFEFSPGTLVLKARVVKCTRAINRLELSVDSFAPSKVMCSFEYLDPGDGAVIELLHTDQKRYPSVTGTIKGIPYGIKSWGSYYPENRRNRWFPFMTPGKVKFLGYIGILLGLVLLVLGLTLPRLPSNMLESGGSISQPFFMVFGSLYSSVFLYGMWQIRRRFPKALSINDDDEF